MTISPTPSACTMTTPERNDVVKLGFYGSGGLPEPMSDFNDVAFIHRRGLRNSIMCRVASDRGRNAQPTGTCSCEVGCAGGLAVSALLCCL